MHSQTETGKTQLLFIINPISGGKTKDEFPELIRQNIDNQRFDYELFWWEQVEELSDRIDQFVQAKGDIVVAVGGDGTINNIAGALAGSEIALAIVPMGSGNGLARELKVPMDAQKAIERLNQGSYTTLDVGYLNTKPFVNVAGWGFDAQVSTAFAQLARRGFWSYVRAVVQEYRGTSNYRFEVNADGKIVEKQAFMLTVANGTQWGNDFFVAPDASYSDGMLDLVFLKKPKLYHIPGLVRSLYRKKPHRLLSRMRTSQAQITCNETVFTHLDGEPNEAVTEVQLEVRPQGLKLYI